MDDNEYEPQPQAPDIASVVQVDTAESLIAPPGRDVLDSGYSPPDRPIALDERPTASELARPENLDRRLARERPDVAAEEPEEPDELERRTGRLVADGNAVESVDVGVDGGAASAEEAAVHELD